MSRVEHIGDATLYLGDSLELLPAITEAIDVVVTDPPYGVNLGSRTGSSRYQNEPYISFDDTPEYIKTICVPLITTCIERFRRLVMTPGNRCMWEYPKPDDIGVWVNPASTNRGAWGFSYANAFIYFYGKDPRNVGRGMLPNSVTGACDSVAGIDHPCPKPLLFMEWLVNRASLSSETVLDPFMGSGTTGVACARLGRKFIGIEKEPRYFNVACDRIDAAYKQPRLFEERAAFQASLLDGAA